MKTFLRALLVLIIFLVPTSLLLLAYFGLLPGLSQVFGSDKPRDLGVTFTPQDLKNADEKRGTKFTFLENSASEKESLKFSGQKSGSVNLTSAEISALMDRGARSWKYYPLDKAQIKIHEDGTIELSGLLRLDRLAGFARARNYSQQQVQGILGKFAWLKSNPAIYLKGRLSVTDNKVDAQLQEAEIGRLSLPQNLLAQNKENINLFLGEDQIRQTPGLSVNSLNFRNGQMFFNGTYPQEESSAP